MHKSLWPALEKQHSLTSESEMGRLLEYDEFYRILREKRISDRERMALDEFISCAFSNSCWKDFQRNCVENQLEPYEEMRDLIFVYYGKVLKKQLKKKDLQETD